MSYIGNKQSVALFDSYTKAQSDNVIALNRRNRNLLINGGFNVWQRGVSFSTSSTYTADRIRIDNSVDSHTFSQLAVAPGEAGSATFASRNVTNGAAGVSSYGSFSQRIENVRSLAGRTVTLSFRGKADAVKDIAFEFQQNFGSGGSATVLISPTQNTTLGATWAKYSVTITMPSIVGKTVGDNSYLNLIVWFSAGSNFDLRTNTLGLQAGTFDITELQLEEGSVATPFEYRSIGEELALCQRYYQDYSFSQYQYSEEGGQKHFFFITSFRQTPTISFTGAHVAGGSANRVTTSWVTFIALTIGNVSFTADAEL
jgi:hypothetical protein